VAVVILRVPGIYGPGRLPRERLEKGLPVLREADAPWSNRIHVDDLVAACMAGMARGVAGAVYNVSDGQPSTMTDYFNQVADALGLARPRQIRRAEAESEIDPGMRSYLAESRRIDNRRMREELGVTPRYGNLAQGLAASIAAETAAARVATA
jgi:nucleoside-diphosphate-sugar epimerase